jgi:hypothetical protein
LTIITDDRDRERGLWESQVYTVVKMPLFRSIAQKMHPGKLLTTPSGIPIYAIEAETLPVVQNYVERIGLRVKA